MNRVVITGQGSINALAHSANDTIVAMQNGVLGIGPLKFDGVDRLSIKIGGQIRNYDEATHFTRQQLTLYDPFTQFALLSAAEAIAQSGLIFDGQLSEQAGVVLGTAGGGLSTQDANFKALYEDGKNRVHPFVVPRLMNSAAASHISMTHNLRGPTFTVATACASSNHAMGQAFHMIRSGMTKAMVTGGTESMLNLGGIKAWEGLRVMSKDGCRPFCATRNGMVQGEGGAIFVFEELEHARARGADILCEVAGFSMNSDAADIVMPDEQSAARAISGALKDAKLNPEDIGYINAHGTGTAANDKTEVRAIKSVFGGQSANLLVSSTKSMHGHLIGGTGAVEMLACISALRDGIVPPTIGYRASDPECNIDCVPNEAREAKVSATITNAFAFGGLNAVVALQSI